MNKYTYIKLIAGACLLSLVMLFVACSDERIEGEPSKAETVSVDLSLNVPGILPSSSMTKSMSGTEEKYIDNLQVLVFEETPSGEVFSYEAPITKREQLRLTVKAKVSHNDEKYRFVVLANASPKTIVEGTLKADALNQFTFDCAGVWNAAGTSSKPIPMWGEYVTTFAVKKERYVNIMMHRALARVDVGLDFIFDEDGYPTEEVKGLENFKIKNIRVYRTRNKGYVATSSDKMNANLEVVKPNIPGDVKYNLNDETSTTDRKEADEKPLYYEISLQEGADKYIREIYIPESFEVTGKPSMDDVPCLVVGGYYGKDNTDKLSFYRADFAKYEGVKPVERFSILRNYRYVFNITNVTNSGFPDEEKALHSLPMDLVLTVTPWWEKNMNFLVQGNYFFGIESREVILDAHGTLDPEGIFTDANFALLRVPFTTNLLLNSENIKYRWESEGSVDFKVPSREEVVPGEYAFICPNLTEFGDSGGVSGAYLNVDRGRIMFGAEPNVGADGVRALERSDILHLQLENFQFSIKVTQRAANLEYDLLCNKTIVHGKYREDIPLNYTHFLEVQIKPHMNGITQDEFEKEIIEIVSETRKGIYFEFKGTIEEGLANGTVQPRSTDGTYTIKLQGKGTPTKDMNDRVEANRDTPDGILTRIDELRITTNSITDPNSCENTTIIFGYNTKRILAIGANAMYRYGYMLEPNSGSRAFVDASINFGVDPNSTVTMEQLPDDYSHNGNYSNKSDVSARGNAFHIEYMTAGRGMSGESINMPYLNTMLSEFKPDIILTGQAINFSDDAIAAISEFVNKGGVLLMFNEYYPRAESINKMAGAIVGATLSGANEALAQSEFLFTLPTGTAYEDDPILNNSFGDLRGKTWGIDGYFLHGFSGLPMSDIVVYNTRKKDTNPCFFRHKNKPFVFVGDGGFISNAQRYIGPTYQGMYDYCPFAINSAYQPIARTNFLRDKTVDNSKLFGNILLWAVDYAEFNGINAKK
ncbi:fimbrial protein [Dysgonomonas massiliensis]|uniref:fimbrial protein n=1 Tax=Dysgonomonas massiliensis TaxID=2040292 RepID=UPI000C781CA6|nr:fimbrial protein [Dysgonomonas massiliensis]